MGKTHIGFSEDIGRGCYCHIDPRKVSSFISANALEMFLTAIENKDIDISMDICQKCAYAYVATKIPEV